MQSYGSRGSVTNTQDLSSERGVRRLRLTLTDSGNAYSRQDRPWKVETLAQKRRNGYIPREQSAGTDLVMQNGALISNGMKPARSMPDVNGAVHPRETNHQKETMAQEWPVKHLRDELTYIKEVRESLEKVRQKMYGQFGGMQESVQRLSQDMKVVQLLVSSHIELQKSLLESCSDRVQNQEEMKSLRRSREEAEAKVRELRQQLTAAQSENSTLKQQVESWQEVTSKMLKETTVRLQWQHEEQVEELKMIHREEIQALQAQIAEYVRLLEEAQEKIRIAEARIAERDQRISELERLQDCMVKEKGELQQKLQDCELRLYKLSQTNHMDSATIKRSKQLEEEASDLRDRIQHLNDMVFIQQKKVKGLIKEVDALRENVAQKDMSITDLLDRIAIVQCENNELEDKLQYFLSKQEAEAISTRDIAVGCELPLRSEPETQILFSPNDPVALSSDDALSNSRSQLSSQRPSSSLRHSRVIISPRHSAPAGRTRSHTFSAQTSLELSRTVTPGSVRSYARPRTHSNQLYTPYMKLMEITANMKIV
ncbi:hypothetical protein GJAV_G00233680 [Gymnothorax javanicus]|nr:hypothetical protein GJAV_G00233680 [Gymnothorax javanicus]